MIEYKILAGAAEECEATLNVWKEMYDLTILKMCSNVYNNVEILLLRSIPQVSMKEKTQ